MKIGILTLPLHANYGGILQAFALQSVLERMGHEVVVYNLDRTPRRCLALGVLYHFARRTLKTLTSMKPQRFYNIKKEAEYQYKLYLERIQHTQRFIDKYIHAYYLKNYVSQIVESNVDCIVVGSDQIWDSRNGASISGSVSNAFLPFVSKRIKRFSYSASFGKDTWNYTQEQTDIVKEAIKNFVGVSVREFSGVELCRKHLDIDAQVHIDPTMLLTADDYIREVDLKEEESSPGDLLVYILDNSDEKSQVIDFIESKLHLTRFHVNNNAPNNAMSNVQPPVEKWLRGFWDAKFVVTDSFHACVFSILFHKPFIAIGNKRRGLTRFLTLLSRFGFENRLIENVENVKKMDLDDKIDFSHVDSILEKERECSFQYIANCINS